VSIWTISFDDDDDDDDDLQLLV